MAISLGIDHPETTLSPPLGIDQKRKVWGYVAAWVAALLLTGHTVDALQIIWMFPSGLFLWLPDTMNPIWVGIPLGTITYLAHAFFYFRSRRQIATLLLYALLLILLICNVAGCHEMTRLPGNI